MNWLLHLQSLIAEVTLTGSGAHLFYAIGAGLTALVMGVAHVFVWLLLLG